MRTAIRHPFMLGEPREWRLACWACDAFGAAPYDAALARGLSLREAMDLLIAQWARQSDRPDGWTGRHRILGDCGLWS